MTAIRYAPAAEVPLRHRAEVIVVGGGPGGLGAAVMAARAGAQVLLIERFGFLGGMAAAGEVHPFMGNHLHGEPLDGPIYTEWLDRMQAYRAAPEPAQRLMISKDIAMLAAEDLCLAAGVTLLYHHTLIDAPLDGRRIDALVLHSKSGFSAARADVYVDCTGDADLAFRAGCTCEQGGPSGHCQPMTLCFKLDGVARDRAPERAEVNRLYDEAKARGEIDNPRENVLAFSWFTPDVVHFNTTRIIRHDATNGEELSDAEIAGRRQLRQLLAFLRARVPGYEAAEIRSIAHHIGVRESRRVRGEAYLTREDYLARTKFPDAIARVRYPIDIHNPDGTGTEILELPEDDWYEIPYGCLVARDRDNLLVGGRPISVDHAIHSSMRVMPPACTVGQAAGLAAALAAARGCRPAELDGAEVRRRLVAQGARLGEPVATGM